MSSANLPARILIVDDHVIIRRGLRNLIAQRIPSVIVHDVPTLDSMIAALTGPEAFALLVLDLQLSDGNAMERIELIRQRWPELRILVYSMNLERIYAQRVLALGCAGFLSKEADEDEVVKALQTVLKDGTYLGPDMENRLMDQGMQGRAANSKDPFDRLSGRELLVLDLLLDGEGVKSIAGKLDLGISTVATYKARLFEKLSVTNLMELQDKARAHYYRGR